MASLCSCSYTSPISPWNPLLELLPKLRLLVRSVLNHVPYEKFELVNYGTEEASTKPTILVTTKIPSQRNWNDVTDAILHHCREEGAPHVQMKMLEGDWS